MGEAVCSLAGAAGILRASGNLPGVSFRYEAADSWEVFEHLVGRGEWPHRLCTDAHLAATALVQGQRLVSFDADLPAIPRAPLVPPGCPTRHVLSGDHPGQAMFRGSLPAPRVSNWRSSAVNEPLGP